MRIRPYLTTMSLLVPLLLALVASSARADVSPAVQKKLKGKLFLAAEPFPLDGEGDAQVIKNLEHHARATLPRQDEADGVASWHLAFVGFLSRKPGVTDLSVDFYTDDKKRAYVANKRLGGVSPDVSLLASEFDISEDEGLTRGKPYIVNLTATIKGKEVVLATSKLTPQERRATEPGPATRARDRNREM